MIAAADAPELVRLERVTCRYGDAPGARRHQPAHRRRPVHRDRRTVGLGQDDPAARAARARCNRATGTVRRRRRAARRLRPAGGDGRLELPGDRQRVRPDGPHRRSPLAVAQPGRAGRGRRGARPSGDRRARRPPHPPAVRRPAAAGVRRPGVARPAAAAADGRADLRCRLPHPPRDPPPARRPATATGWRSSSPPTTSTASPPTCPHLVCLNTEVIGVGPAADGAHARHPRAHLRRADRGPRTRRDAASSSTRIATSAADVIDLRRESA